MHCPYCDSTETKVIDSRLADEGATVRRRRECLSCCQRVTTRETCELDMPRVIKRDGRRCSFSEDKIRSGMLKALEKRPVASTEIDKSVARIIHEIQAKGERELATETLGELVMVELRGLDQVAYVRFASIYRSFQDVSEFHKEIEKLQELNHND